MASHDIDYQIIGSGSQYAKITLDPGETVISDSGAMVYVDEGISHKVKMGDGSNPKRSIIGKVFSGIKRRISGENFFLTHFQNESTKEKTIGFAGNFPGSIVGVDLKKVGGSLTCQKDAFLCAAYGT
ncbi:MAG: hypothetical protein ACJATU_001052, partial [Rickettsiales bacterium]